MANLDKAIAAAPAALAVPADDAEAVAWQARLKIAGCERWSDWGEVDDIEHFKRFHDERGNAYEVRALYAAPPAALAVPAGYSHDDVCRIKAGLHPAAFEAFMRVEPALIAMLAAAERKGE